MTTQADTHALLRGIKEYYIKQLNEYLYSKKYNNGLADLIIVITEFANTINDCPRFAPQGTPADMRSIVLQLLDMHYSSSTFLQRPLQKFSPPDDSNQTLYAVNKTKSKSIDGSKDDDKNRNFQPAKSMSVISSPNSPWSFQSAGSF